MPSGDNKYPRAGPCCQRTHDLKGRQAFSKSVTMGLGGVQHRYKKGWRWESINSDRRNDQPLLRVLAL